MADHLQTIIFMVRHGETDRFYNTDRGIDAQRQLTEKGRDQVKKVGEYLKEFGPSKIYSSPLDRCKDSAEIIKDTAQIEASIDFTEQLVEIYSSEPRQEAGQRGESIFQTILANHRGEQVVAVSHQYIIGYIVADFLKVSYHDVPCDFADIWRLVFADETLVEATRLAPAKAG